jgi:hypothetical protein
MKMSRLWTLIEGVYSLKNAVLLSSVVCYCLLGQNISKFCDSHYSDLTVGDLMMQEFRPMNNIHLYEDLVMLLPNKMGRRVSGEAYGAD